MPHDIAQPHHLSEHRPDDGGGCAYLLDSAEDDPAGAAVCGAPIQPGSAYCPVHHARCHRRADSRAERRQLRRIEALAIAVGGRQGRPAREPPPPVLQRFDRRARAFLRAECSRIVPRGDSDASER